MGNFLLKSCRQASLGIFAALLLVGLMGPGAADTSGGRFQLKEAGSGQFVRLDSDTGAMSICSREGDAWTCRAMADDRAALHEEIAKLKQQNAELTDRLKTSSGGLPDDADLDRVMSLFEKYVERFLSFISKLDRKQNAEGI